MRSNVAKPPFQFFTAQSTYVQPSIQAYRIKAQHSSRQMSRGTSAPTPLEMGNKGGAHEQKRAQVQKKTKTGTYHLGSIMFIDHVASLCNTQQADESPKMKRRPAIVMTLYESSLICFPLFTSGGNGFVKKPRDMRENCIRLRGSGDNAVHWTKIDPSEYLLAEPGFVVRKNSYMELSKPYSIEYSHCDKPVGRLTTDAFARLTHLWHQTIEKGQTPLEEQSLWIRGEKTSLEATQKSGNGSKTTKAIKT